MPIQEFFLDRVLAELELNMDEVCVRAFLGRLTQTRVYD